LQAEPADDRHAAIFTADVDEGLAAEVMVEVDFVPGLTQLGDTVFDRLDPDGSGALLEEGSGTVRIVVEKKNAAHSGR
jgi:hypothetical protein